MINHDKGPYQPSSIVKGHKGFEVLNVTHMFFNSFYRVQWDAFYLNHSSNIFCLSEENGHFFFQGNNSAKMKSEQLQSQGWSDGWEADGNC